MWKPAESLVASSPLLLQVRSKSQSQEHVKHTGPNIVGMQPLPYNIRKGQLQIAKSQSQTRRIRCAAALNARCAAGQTQTVTRESQTITLTPVKDKSPKLDDNGPGFPPRDDDGNGGNGGGGGKWSGGLVLLGVLGVLDILKEIESEWLRKNNDRTSHRA